MARDEGEREAKDGGDGGRGQRAASEFGKGECRTDGRPSKGEGRKGNGGSASTAPTVTASAGNRRRLGAKDSRGQGEGIGRGTNESESGRRRERGDGGRGREGARGKRVEGERPCDLLVGESSREPTGFDCSEWPSMRILLSTII